MQAADAGTLASQHPPTFLPPPPPPPASEREQHLERQVLEASGQFQEASSQVHYLEEQMAAMRHEYE